MALFEHWEIQYQHGQIFNVPHEGRTFTHALYEKDEQDPRIASIILNRPEKANALSDEMYEDICAGMHKAADDPAVRVVVIKAKGAGFCSGHDLQSEKEDEGRPTRQSSIINPKWRPAIRDYINLERRRCTKDIDMMVYPKIVIAQIHGYAVWAGEYLGRIADICVCADDTRLGAWGNQWVIHTLHTCNVFWFGHPADSKKEGRGPITQLTGQRAADAGLITKSVPKSELAAEVKRIASVLVELEPETVLMAKSMINDMLLYNNMDSGMRAHFGDHISLQFTRFRPGEVGLYKLRRDAGSVKAFVEHREAGLAAAKFKSPWRS